MGSVNTGYESFHSRVLIIPAPTSDSIIYPQEVTYREPCDYDGLRRACEVVVREVQLQEVVDVHQNINQLQGHLVTGLGGDGQEELVGMIWQSRTYIAHSDGLPWYQGKRVRIRRRGRPSRKGITRGRFWERCVWQASGPCDLEVRRLFRKAHESPRWGDCKCGAMTLRIRPREMSTKEALRAREEMALLKEIP